MSNYNTSLTQSTYGVAYFWGVVILATAASQAVADDSPSSPAVQYAAYTSSALPSSAPASENLALNSSEPVDSGITEASVAVYQKLLEEQKPLEPEFAQILEDNFWDLCGA